ncbi:23S rRNA (adenine(2503)-C(2))-methyltransferase RlmN [Candidatus Poriferisodalis sp.]|uniref:23S rRNA (adenine(2503)-C(2))-methyltransferase RlmN n=1 Tax=Candidatus Poriferisodalis sp. TaxID=3101277 RepID=UPI003B526F55
MADLGADPSLGDLSRADFGELLEGEPAYRLDQVWEGLYVQRRPLAEITNVPKSLRRAIGELLPPALTLVRTQSADRGTTTKHLWSLRDGHLVESVLMRYRDRTTLCISSQAGCAMGCSFCATGQVGFDRNLRVGEIVEQVLGTLQEASSTDRAAPGRAVNSDAAPGRAVNIVFMGMGEPLANYDAVWAAVERFHDDMGIGARHITVSTVGVVPGIARLAAAGLPVNLAVSLHAANDRLRNRVAPINRTYPLRDLARALADYRRAKRRRISLEWAMIGGVNDSDRDAAELAAFARPLAAHVNLIPLNPTPGYVHQPTPRERIEHFAAELASHGVNATVRVNRGTSIDAACGQLRADKLVSIRKGSRPARGARARAER